MLRLRLRASCFLLEAKRIRRLESAWRTGPQTLEHLAQQAPGAQCGASPARQFGTKQRTAFTPGPLHVEGAPSHCATALPVELYTVATWRSAATTWSRAQQ